LAFVTDDGEKIKRLFADMRTSFAKVLPRWLDHRPTL
jgi:hypothetical protein